MIVLWPQSSPGRREAGGFSLLEMLLVIVILLVLVVMMGGPLGLPGHNRRVLLSCQKNLQTIYLALSIYQNDNKGAFPYLTGATNPAVPLSLLVPKCTTVTGIFLCPGSKIDPLPEAEPFATRKISYAYSMGVSTNDDPGEILASDAQVDAAPKRAGQQIFSADGHKPGNNHGKDGGNLLSRGGEVTSSAPRASRDVLFPPSVRLLNPE